MSCSMRAPILPCACAATACAMPVFSDGDIAIVRRQEHADNGDIVVAMIEEAATLKRFFLESNRIRLQAENAAYPPIFTQDLRILGRLRAVQRAY